jgi:hypothetical protein
MQRAPTAKDQRRKRQFAIRRSIGATKRKAVEKIIQKTDQRKRQTKDEYIRYSVETHSYLPVRLRVVQTGAGYDEDDDNESDRMVYEDVVPSASFETRCSICLTPLDEQRSLHPKLCSSAHCIMTHSLVMMLHSQLGMLGGTIILRNVLGRMCIIYAGIASR